MKTVYELLFVIGALGFLAMTALGFAHSGHGGARGLSRGGPGGGGHSGGGHSGGGHSHSGHSGGGHGVRHQALGSPKIARTAPGSGLKSAKGVKTGRTRNLSPWFAISPLDLFSFALGAGAVGILARGLLQGNGLAAAAVVGALVFNFGLVKPLMGALLRFASRPSEGLEGAVAQEAEAITRFDDAGRGLVRLILDGQAVQLLATLDSSELASGIQVAKGDPVIVTEVDPTRNTCRVTRELAL